MQRQAEWKLTNRIRHAPSRPLVRHPLVVLLAINILGLGVTGGLVMRLLEERDHAHERMADLEREAREHTALVGEVRQRTEERASAQQIALEKRLDNLTQQWHGQAYEALTRGLGEVSGIADAEKRARTQADTSIAERMSELEKRLARVQQQAEQHDLFARLENEAAAGVLLVHSAFDYHIKGTPKTELQSGTGWGSGFLISADGVLITNKHVLKPWLFDADMASLIADGDVEIVGPTRIYVWRAGDRCMRENGELDFENAWSQHGARKLRVLAFAADHMRAAQKDDAGRMTEPPLHELDNNDLGVLQIDGGPFPYLTLAPAGRTRKLDRVMALGYPRGCRGLERGIVQSSPSLGTVRKAEDTIHVTASIIPGNSGGPLLNERGEVAGVVTRIYSETLGICIRADVVSALLDEQLRGAMAQRADASLVTLHQPAWR